MSLVFPPDLEEFVQKELTSGHFESEEALLTAALRVYRDLAGRHDELRRRIDAAVAEGDAGELAELDIDSVIRELEEEVDVNGQPR